MKIAFLSIEDASSKDSFSGSSYRIVSALREAGHRVDCLGPLQVVAGRLETRLRRAFPRLSRRHPEDTSRWRMRAIGRLADERINKAAPDVILSRGTWPLVHLDTRIPVALWHDATHKLLLSGYAGFGDQHPRAQQRAEHLERLGLKRADLLFYTSNWALNSARDDYGVPPEKLRRALLGANRECARSDAELEASIDSRDFSRLRLLFIGTEWERKGGDRFVALVRRLEAMGVPVEANMIGPWPPSHFEVPRSVRCHGRIRLSDEQGAAFLESLFLSAHCLVLPTRNDCTPVVIPDSLSHGLPVVASKVGGIPEMLDERLGMVCDFASEAELGETARRLAELQKAPHHWRSMARAARREFLERQNWRTHAETLAKGMESLLK